MASECKLAARHFVLRTEQCILGGQPGRVDALFLVFEGFKALFDFFILTVSPLFYLSAFYNFIFVLLITKSLCLFMVILVDGDTQVCATTMAPFA